MSKNFKELIMMLNNNKAKKVRKYYFKLEELLDK
jgi:phage anti-repressor protein